MGFCQKWEVKFSHVQNWLAFAKVGGTVKSEYCPACTSGTRTAKTKWEAYFWHWLARASQGHASVD